MGVFPFGVIPRSEIYVCPHWKQQHHLGRQVTTVQEDINQEEKEEKESGWDKHDLLQLASMIYVQYVQSSEIYYKGEPYCTKLFKEFIRILNHVT